jgi:chemosensory pili system protein ChpA (sensor histidine kinase/response regulator)
LNYAIIDLASLAWLLPELDSTIKLARTSLAKTQQSNGIELVKSLTAAKRAIHEATGALQVIEARGVIHFLETLEKTIEQCILLGRIDTHAYAVLDEACFAVMAYLNELKNTGVLIQPIVLYPEYESLCLLNPTQGLSHSYHPTDLYFPNLTPRLSIDDQSNKTKPDANPINLHKVRNAYEILLLRVFKQNASKKDLDNLSLLLGIIANDAGQAHAHSFWKTCQTVTQGLQETNAGLELDVKRWLGRLNLQIQRLTSGSKHLSERLFREALYYVAAATPNESSPSKQQQAVMLSYQLAGSVPNDLKQRRYGHAIPVDTSVLLEKLNAFKLAWDDAAPAESEAEGISSSETILLRRLKTAQQVALGLQLSLSEHHLPILVQVAQGLAQAAATVCESGKPLHKSLGLEGAKAILWIEEALKRVGQPQSSQHEQAQLIIARLHESKLTDAPLPAAARERNRDTQILMGEVIREAMLTLSGVEKQLDDYFRYSQDAAVLESTLAPLAQSRSTLDLLGLPQVSLALSAIEKRIKHFSTQTVPATPAEFSSLAIQFSQVTYLLDMFTRAPDRVQNDFIFDAATGGLKDQRLAAEKTDAHSFDSVESLSHQRRTDAQALIKEVVAKPEDPNARLALVESIQALKDDAALTGDTALSALGSVALSPVTVMNFPVDLKADTLTQAAQAESISNDAKALAALNALLSPTVITVPSAAPMAHSEDDLYGIFLEEAHDVLADAEHLLHELEAQPSATPILTDLRRSFHTLKGSSRMVGFKAFGDAAWHVEQVVNNALARQTPASMDLIQFMRGAQEALSIWLSQLDETLLNMDLEGSSNPTESPDFTVASTVPAFISKLAPYLKAIERGYDRLVSAPTSPQSSSALTSPSAVKHPSTNDPSSFSISSLEALSSVVQDPMSNTLIPSPTIRPKISLVANNEGLRPQDFIEKARSAVLRAQAIESNEPILPPPSLVLQPVHIAPPTAATPTQESMVSIGPLRLPKPLYDIYVQEAGQHIDGLLSDLRTWHTQTPRPSLYEAYKQAHSLKGSAATIGFGVMKDLAAPLESVLQLSVESELVMLPSDLTVLDGALQSIKKAFDTFALGSYPAASNPSIEALSALHIKLTQRTKPAPFAAPHSPSSHDNDTQQKLIANALNEAQAIDALALQALEVRVAAVSFDAAPKTPTNNVFDVFNTDFEPSKTAAEDMVFDEIDHDIWLDFVQEADVIMPKAQNSLLVLPGDNKSINDLRRDLHTLKGSSRMAGAMRMGAMLHAMESKLESSLKEQAPFLTADAHGALLDDYDDIHTLYESLKNPKLAPHASNEISAQTLETAPYLSMMVDASALFDDALSAPNTVKVSPSNTHPNQAAWPPVAPEVLLSPTVLTVPPETKAPTFTPLVVNTTPKPTAVPNTSTEHALALPALRMQTEMLDHLVNQASEMSTSKGRIDQHVVQLRASLRELTDNVERLRKQLREIEIQAESQMATRTELVNTDEMQFDPLEFDRFTRFQELTRMLTESLNDMIAVRDSVSKSIVDTERELVVQSKANKDLTQSLMRSRLVAFDAVSDRLYRVVRQTARELGKQVTLDIQGGHLTLDRSILERMSAGLEHLVRNSVVHGIESPELRSSRSKAPQGTITIQIKQQGNELEINLSDDGSGIPLERIRDVAIAKGMLSTQSLPTVQQLAEFIFSPGFSTADTITELAGRGVGMDVVRSDIVSLGGRITLSTTAQQSTRFSIRIPLTLAINQVLMVIAQQVQYAIPTSLIQSVVTVKPSDLAQAYDQGQITQRGLNYPFAHLAELLNIAVNASAQNRAASVILLGSGSDTVAIHVEQVIGNQEVVVKPLSSAMLRIPGLSSATLLNDGKLCLIIDPVQLHLSQLHQLDDPSVSLKNYSAPTSRLPTRQNDSAYSLSAQRGNSQIDTPTPMVQVVSTRTAEGVNVLETLPKERARKLAMVIDDSLTVRKVTEKLLRREGWEVLLAKDGIDALEQLQTVNPSVLLVDIEMPRMDGYDLTRNVRADERLMAIPIIMITSRIADKHRDHAFSLGVNAYMGKPYRDDELIAEMIKLTTVSA